MVSGFGSPEPSSPVAGSDRLEPARKRGFDSDRLSDSDDDLPSDAEVGPLVGQIRDFERSRREFLARAAPGAKVPRPTITKTLRGGLVFVTRPRPRIGPEYQAEIPPLPANPRPVPPPFPTLTLLEESAGGSATVGALGTLREDAEGELDEAPDAAVPQAPTPLLADRPVPRLVPRGVQAEGGAFPPGAEAADAGRPSPAEPARAPVKRRGIAAPRRALPRE